MKLCFKCATPWPEDKRQPGYKDVCAQCGAFLHACKNCKHHLRSAHNECYIPNTEWVADRARGNFCDEFEFKDADAQRAGAASEDRAREALSGLLGGIEPAPDRKIREALLGDKPDSDGDCRKFDDLFKS